MNIPAQIRRGAGFRVAGLTNPGQLRRYQGGREILNAIRRPMRGLGISAQDCEGGIYIKNGGLTDEDAVSLVARQFDPIRMFQLSQVFKAGRIPPHKMVEIRAAANNMLCGGWLAQKTRDAIAERDRINALVASGGTGTPSTMTVLPGTVITDPVEFVDDTEGRYIPPDERAGPEQPGVVDLEPVESENGNGTTFATGGAGGGAAGPLWGPSLFGGGTGAVEGDFLGLGYPWYVYVGVAAGAWWLMGKK